MAVANDAIKVDGLREFQAALKKMDGQSQKMLRLVLNDVVKVVADAARPTVAHGKTGKAAGSVKPQSSQREGSVKAGGARAPYYPWLDFGGRVGKHKSVHRPFLKEGRYLFPAYKANKGQVEAKLGEGLQKLITDSGLDAS